MFLELVYRLTLIIIGIMLSKDYRLRLTEICCRMRLGRDVSLIERIWVYKLIRANKHAAGIAERIKG